ncbi:ferritin-like domain-containing protein [Rhizobium leguminosarum]|uniref:ferritin-like domain-containing protein n=1 Tax=Rhizobium leguminosarum TaxID=384 RepID=UPI0013E91368|nr:ferritin-like domain-containing protein [Rhizobium leguminosarum]
MTQTPAERQRDILIDPDFGVGIPIVDGAHTAKDYAMGLLRLAAEVEHALMVQYLYAADSIDPDDDARNNAVKLRRIAQEEMGHLGTVQNLLLLLGGPRAFYLQRDLIRRGNPANPIAFVLEPVSRHSLAKYVVAEMPEEVPESKQAKVDELIALAETDMGFKPHRVGAIYAMIRWLFLPKAEALAWMDLKALFPDAPLPDSPHLEDADFQEPAIIALHEVFGEDWGDDSGHFLLERAIDRQSALDALDLITDQGEGLGGADSSHFEEFLELIDAFDIKPFGRPIATSPTLTVGHGGEKPTPVVAPYTAKWLEVQSLQYQLLIVGLLHGLAHPRTTDDTLRSDLAELCLKSMRRLFGMLAKLLTRMPVGADGSISAGPSYDLEPAQINSADIAEYVRRQLAIMDRLAVLYAEIEQTGDDVTDQLAELRLHDRGRRKLLKTLSAQIT